MTVSKAIVPLLKGKAADSIQKTIFSSRIKPYTTAERNKTIREIHQILKSKKKEH